MKRRSVGAALLAALLWWAPASFAQEQRLFIRGSYDAIRASHSGKPLIVHMWGLTCTPCLTELPQWGQLAARHTDVALVLIEADRAGGTPDRRAHDRLISAGLGSVESWVFGDRFEERLRFEIDPDWQGELPRTLLITASGAVTAIVGPAEMAEVERWIAQQER